MLSGDQREQGLRGLQRVSWYTPFFYFCRCARRLISEEASRTYNFFLHQMQRFSLPKQVASHKARRVREDVSGLSQAKKQPASRHQSQRHTSITTFLSM